MAPAFSGVRMVPHSPEITPATPADVPLLLELIRELAEFEQLLHAVDATADSLGEALFGARPDCEAVVARVAGEAVGFALYFHNFSTFRARRGLYLEDLYVRPAMRGHGVGKALLLHLAAIAAQRGCARFEWAVLDWNQRAIDFYRSMGAVPMDEWTVFRVSGEALAALAQSAPAQGLTAAPTRGPTEGPTEDIEE
jgi:GNAT superfamily N-acetyltransferase